MRIDRDQRTKLYQLSFNTYKDNCITHCNIYNIYNIIMLSASITGVALITYKIIIPLLTRIMTVRSTLIGISDNSDTSLELKNKLIELNISSKLSIMHTFLSELKYEELKYKNTIEHIVKDYSQTIEKIEEILLAIEKKLLEHSQKYFPSYRYMDYSIELKYLLMYNKILKDQFSMLTVLLK